MPLVAKTNRARTHLMHEDDRMEMRMGANTARKLLKQLGVAGRQGLEPR
jgi:hypothetical protein